MAHLGEDLRSAGARGATTDDSHTDRPVERHVDVRDRAAHLLHAGEAAGDQAEGSRGDKGKHDCGTNCQKSRCLGAVDDR